MKRYIALLTCLFCSYVPMSYAEESEDDSISATYEAEIRKLNQTINELQTAKEDKWHVDTYLGTEQERDHDEDWNLLVGSIATSPYVGAFIYQDNSPWMYDVQVLKTYMDRNDEYNRTRWQFGATRAFPFKIADKDATFKLRLGYRNDNYHYRSSITAQQVASGSLIRTAEERHEYWVKPVLSYRYSNNLSFVFNLSFRFIDRKLDYAPTGQSKSDWGHINEHFVGGSYKFNEKNSLTLYYLYVDEKLVNTLYNKEHFLWGIYSYKFDNGFTVMPYTRFSLKHGKQSFRNADNIETTFKEKDRSRYGFQTIYPFTKQASLFTDFYYRPEKTWQNGAKTKSHFIFMALELRYNF